MKKILIITLIFLLNTGLFSQSGSQKNDMSKETITVANEGNSFDLLSSSISERVITTSVIVGEILILLVLLFYWKRTKDDSKLKSNSIYRNNIKALRYERVKPNLNVKQSSLRKILRRKINLRSLNGETITKSAKKMSVAKGELFLAARIMQLQNQNK